MATNTVVLAGTIIHRDALRATPGGTAVLNLTLKHQSQQREGQQQVTVEVEINAIAFDQVAQALNAQKLDDQIAVKGFLSRKNQYSPTPILHITQFKILK
jgi:primosomal replication protein PriB